MLIVLFSDNRYLSTRVFELLPLGSWLEYDDEGELGYLHTDTVTQLCQHSLQELDCTVAFYRGRQHGGSEKGETRKEEA